MSRNGWHILRQDNVLTLTRRLPVRFDVAAETCLPDGARGRLAHQVRQDLWRCLQSLKGFSPVVQLTRSKGQIHVRAGGQVDGPVPAGINAAIADLLECPDIRARWQAYGAHRPLAPLHPDLKGTA